MQKFREETPVARSMHTGIAPSTRAEIARSFLVEFQFRATDCTERGKIGP